MFRLPEDVAERVDWNAALQAVLDRPASMLPTPLLDWHVRSHTEEYAGWLGSVLEEGIDVRSPEFLFAPKPAGGLRPVPAMALPERVLYQALAQLLAVELPASSRERMNFRDFERAPLDFGGNFILSSDISNCYDFIDHELLASTLVHATGDRGTSIAVAGFLGQLMNRPLGLPHNLHASHVVSDPVIDVAERRMLRKGYQVWRFSDDFRIAADSWEQMSEAMQDLEREVRRLGLGLNGEKSLRRDRQGYTTKLDAPTKIRRDIDAQLAADFETQVSEYDDSWDAGELFFADLIDAEDDDTEDGIDEDGWKRLASARFLEMWREEGVEHERTPVEMYAYRQVLGEALGNLRELQDPAAVDYCELILRREPSFAADVAKYLVAQEPEAARQGLARIAGAALEGNLYVFPWQACWLAAAAWSRDAVSRTGLVAEWLKKYLRSPSHPAAAWSALALSRDGAVDAADITPLLGIEASPYRGEALRALATLDRTNRAVDATAGDDPALRWVVEGL